MNYLAMPLKLIEICIWFSLLVYNQWSNSFHNPFPQLSCANGFWPPKDKKKDILKCAQYTGKLQGHQIVSED